MTEFFTNGELKAPGANLAVHDSRHNPVPWRILQLGPGDFCRIAFQTVPKQHLYKIYYGGKGEPEKPPAWTNRAGLLLETRHWSNCNFQSLDSVRETFQTAEPFGSAFVPAVFHRFNPFWPNPEPFLSEYQGTLRIPGGTYRFFTSSQDCSFLLIDGKLVVAAPGWHGPVHDSRIKGEVNLSAGPHEFQYLHAAAGAGRLHGGRLAASGSGQARSRFRPEAFGSEAIGQFPSTGVKHLHEYSVDIAGEVPLAGSELPLVRVQFRSVSTRGVDHPAQGTLGFRRRPDQQPGRSRAHLPASRPVHGDNEGRRRVRLAGHHQPGADPPRLVFADQNHPPDQLAPYLTILDKYDPAKLDPAGLLQLVRAFEAGGQFARAAKAGQAGILAGREPTDSDSAMAVARLVGGLLRDRLDDAAAAFSFLARRRQGTEARGLEGGMRDRGGRPCNQRPGPCRAGQDAA